MNKKKILKVLLVAIFIFAIGINVEAKQLEYVKCGSVKDIPAIAPQIFSVTIKVFKAAVPIALIISGMISVVKAVAASKEDEINKAKSAMVRKLVAAALAFFVITIVQFVISLAADSTEQENVVKCIDCFVNNSCKDTRYCVENDTEVTCDSSN